MGSSSSAWKVVRWAITLVVLALACVGLLSLQTPIELVEHEHYAFLRHVHLGMTEKDAVAAVGKPKDTYSFADCGAEIYQRFGDGYSPGYYHSWHGLGRIPLEFDHVAKYSHAVAWGEYLFYDEKDRIICILWGSS